MLDLDKTNEGVVDEDAWIVEDKFTWCSELISVVDDENLRIGLVEMEDNLWKEKEVSDKIDKLLLDEEPAFGISHKQLSLPFNSVNIRLDFL